MSLSCVRGHAGGETWTLSVNMEILHKTVPLVGKKPFLLGKPSGWKHFQPARMRTIGIVSVTHTEALSMQGA
ncbi:hypothetical protein KIL84_001823 [Mauremys mutica]|uniref:Uncharacterized protein n=1 Tax=Mauremys mutica TaxID=74926 RepID=A0A9D3XHW3_9SAUR|nr:hypothetical protein KIL84_001823 [Mauremys mutica]